MFMVFCLLLRLLGSYENINRGYKVKLKAAAKQVCSSAGLIGVGILLKVEQGLNTVKHKAFFKTYLRKVIFITCFLLISI